MAKLHVRGIAAALIVASVSVTPRAAARADGPEQRGWRDTGPTWQVPGYPPIRQRYGAPPGSDPLRRIRYWNQLMLNANGIDCTPVQPGETRVFGEQAGPGRTSRAFAIVQIAVHDAVSAIAHRYDSYTDTGPGLAEASPDAAIAVAAHDTIVAEWPSQAHAFDRLLDDDLRRLPPGRARAAGIRVGHRAAAAILALRAEDGSQVPDPVIGVGWFPSDQPGKWRPDPVSGDRVALGAFWGAVRPFVFSPAAERRIPPPPDLTSDQYTQVFQLVKGLGGDGVTTPTVRTREETAIGVYWAYDGTPGLGKPPRELNQIAVQIAAQAGTDYVDLARLLALLNAGLADAAIECWEAKYRFQFWRPVTAIREADAGTGPTGLGDGNPNTEGDPTWTPLGAPATNTHDPNFTPPFPSYPSGHATLSGTAFELLRLVYGTDRVRFTFVSDELDGVNRDNQGVVRPLLPRTYATLSAAEAEMGASRILLGIHWPFDMTAGDVHGREIAGYVFAHAFRPRTR